jgi:GNAT superfamily N-acetyltransferase
VHVRDAVADDLPTVVALLADDQLGVEREQVSGALDPAYRDALAAIDRDEHNRLVVLVDHEEIVGTLQLTFIPSLTFRGGWRAQIEAVRIAVDRRGAGAGRFLMDWAIAAARERGCFLVQLTTNRRRDRARAFYESLGFVASHHGMKLYLRAPS